MSDGPIELEVHAEYSQLDSMGAAMERSAEQAKTFASTMESTLGRLANLSGSSFGFDLTPTIRQNIEAIGELERRLAALHGAYQAAASVKPIAEAFPVAARREVREVHDQADARLAAAGQQLGIPPAQLTALRQAQSQAILQSGAGIGKEMRAMLVREFSSAMTEARKSFGRTGSLSEIKAPQGFLSDVPAETRHVASGLAELAREAINATQAARALGDAAREVARNASTPQPTPTPTPAPQTTQATSQTTAAPAAPATQTGGVGGGNNQPPTPPPAAAAPAGEPPRGGGRDPQVTNFEANLAKLQALFDRKIASGDLHPLGKDLATNENQEFHHRDLGKLDDANDAHFEHILNATEALGHAMERDAKRLSDAFRTLNQNDFRTGVASGRIQPLGGSRSPYGIDRTTDTPVHRDLGKLNEGLAGEDPVRADALAESEARLVEFRRVQAADAQKSIANSQKLAAADAAAAEAKLRAIGAVAETLRQQSRINAGDPDVTAHGKYVVDKSGDQPRVQRREGAGLIDVEAGSAEAMRVLGVAARREARALTESTKATEEVAQRARGVGDAREAARQLAERQRQQGRLNAKDPFITEQGPYIIDKAGDRPTVQRREGRQGIVDLDSSSPEAMRVLGQEELRDAAALKKQAEEAAKATAALTSYAQVLADAREAARQLSERQRQEGRINARDPFIEDRGTHIIDRAGDTPTVQRRVGSQGIVDLSPTDPEAIRQLGASQRKQADAAAKQAEATAKQAEATTLSTRQIENETRERNRREFDSGRDRFARGGPTPEEIGQALPGRPRQLQPLGPTYARDIETNEFFHRDLGLLSNRAEELAKALAIYRGKLDDAATAANQEVFRSKVGNRDIERLGAPGTAFGAYGVDRKTGDISHRDLGVLSNTNPDHAPELYVAQVRQGELESAAIKKRVKAADDAADADEAYVQAAIKAELALIKVNRALDATERQELLGQVKKQSLADSQASYQSLSQRQLAKDPTLRRVDERHLEDTSGPQPEVFRINKQLGIAQQLSPDERRLVLANEELAKARDESAKAEKAATAANAKLLFQNTLQRKINRDPTLRDIDKNTIEDTSGPTPRVIKTNETAGTAVQLDEAESQLVLSTKKLKGTLDARAEAEQRALYEQLAARRLAKDPTLREVDKNNLVDTSDPLQERRFRVNERTGTAEELSASEVRLAQVNEHLAQTRTEAAATTARRTAADAAALLQDTLRREAAKDPTLRRIDRNTLEDTSGAVPQVIRTSQSANKAEKLDEATSALILATERETRARDEAALATARGVFQGLAQRRLAGDKTLRELDKNTLADTSDPLQEKVFRYDAQKGTAEQLSQSEANLALVNEGVARSRTAASAAEKRRITAEAEQLLQETLRRQTAGDPTLRRIDDNRFEDTSGPLPSVITTNERGGTAKRLSEAESAAALATEREAKARDEAALAVGRTTFLSLAQRRLAGDTSLRDLDRNTIADTSDPNDQKVFRFDAQKGTAERLSKSDEELALINEGLGAARRELTAQEKRQLAIDGELLLQDVLRREAAKDPTLRRIDKTSLEDTSGPTPRVIFTNEQTRQARTGTEVESSLALATEHLTKVRDELALAESKALFQDLLKRHLDPNDTTVRQLNKTTFEDSKSGTTQYAQINAKDGTARQLTQSEADLVRATQKATADRKEAAAAEAELARATREQSRRGVLNNFLAGVSNPGFGSTSGFDGKFDGIARSGGQLVKYQLLNTAMGLLQQAATSAAQEFLDMDDSVTELQVAMGNTSDVASDFAKNLQDVAAVGGFNVGESMDVAAKGVRAFKGALQEANGNIDVTREQMQGLGEDFSKQASRLAVLATTTLTDSSGNLAAVAQGYNLKPNEGGFSQVTDAVAGAKRAGGGDETQIYQGLANAAVTFNQMGFSLREAATIISTLNAQTDQSGTLLATRVSRLGAILEGQSGKDFIRQINQTRPTGTAAVDVTASARDQIGQLAALYKKLDESKDEAGKQVLTSRLGGTAQAREILLLLKGFTTITDAAKDNSLFDNAGAEEFEKRLTNVRAQITQIQGNLKAIITNLALSGLADPFVTLIEVLRPISGFLKDATQAISTFAQAFGPLTPVLTNLAAIMLTLRGIAAIRAAGGIGAALTGVEQRLAPGRALNRIDLKARLAEDARKQENPASPLASDATVRAGAIVGATNNSVEDQKLVAAATQLHAAASELEIAEGELRDATRAQAAAAEADLAAARETVAAKTKVVNEKRTGLNNAVVDLEREEEQRGLRQGVDTRFNARKSDADEAYRKDRSRNRAELDRVQTKIDDQQAKGPKGLGRFLAVDYSADKERLEKEGNDREKAYQAELKAIARQRRVAEEEIIQAAKLGRRGAHFDEATGGLVVAGRAQREVDREDGTLGARLRGAFRRHPDDEGLRDHLGNIGPRLEQASGLNRRIGSFEGAADAVGGAAGVAGIVGIAAVTAAFEFKSTMDSVAKAQLSAAEATKTYYGGSAVELRRAASEQAAAAQSLRESTDGFFGGLADSISSGGQFYVDPNTGQRQEDVKSDPITVTVKAINDAWNGAVEQFREVTRGAASEQADALQAQADYKNSVANSVEAAQTKGAEAGGAAGLAAAIDNTSVDTLTASISRLREMGYSATEIVDGFNASLAAYTKNDLDTFQAKDLNKDKQVALAGTLAATVPGAIQSTIEEYRGLESTGYARIGPNMDLDKYNNGPGNGAPTGRQIRDADDALSNRLGSGVLQQQVRGASQKFLADNPNADLNSQATRDAYEKVIRATLESASVPPDAAKRIAAKQAVAFAAAISEQNEQFKKDPQKLIDYTKALPAIGSLVNQDATQGQRLKQLQSGSELDTSKSVGIDAEIQFQQGELARLGPKLGDLIRSGADKTKVGEASAALAAAERHLVDLRLDHYQAVAAEAKDFIAHQAKLRTAALHQGATLKALEALGNTNFTSDFQAALKSGSVDVILSVLNNASKAQIAVAKQAVKDTVTVARAKYNNDSKVYNGLKAEADNADSAYDALVKGSAPQAAIDGAKKRKDAAHAALSGAVKPNAGPLNTAIQNQNAFDKAVGEAVPQDNYSTANDTLGGTKASRAADDEAAQAELSKDRLGALKAAKDKADAALAEAKKGDPHGLTEDYKQKLKAVYAANNAYNEGLLDVAATSGKSVIDLSNSLTVAKAEYKNALEKLKQDQANPAISADELRRDRIDLAEKGNAVAAQTHSQTMRDIDDQADLGEISQAKKLQLYIVERDRLQTLLSSMKDTDQDYDAVKQQLIDSKKKILATGKEMSGQFNIGDIKIPTVYEVRRAIKAASASASTVNSAVIANTTNNTIAINGADLAAVEALLKKYMGSGDRYTTQPRRV